MKERVFRMSVFTDADTQALNQQFNFKRRPRFHVADLGEYEKEQFSNALIDFCYLAMQVVGIREEQVVNRCQLRAPHVGSNTVDEMVTDGYLRIGRTLAGRIVFPTAKLLEHAMIERYK